MFFDDDENPTTATPYGPDEAQTNTDAVSTALRRSLRSGGRLRCARAAIHLPVGRLATRVRRSRKYNSSRSPGWGSRNGSRFSTSQGWAAGRSSTPGSPRGFVTAVDVEQVAVSGSSAGARTTWPRPVNFTRPDGPESALNGASCEEVSFCIDEVLAGQVAARVVIQF